MALSRHLPGVTEEGYSVNVLAKSRCQVIVKIDFLALGAVFSFSLVILVTNLFLVLV